MSFKRIDYKNRYYKFTERRCSPSVGRAVFPIQKRNIGLNKNGFSALELMVAIAIVGILAGIAMPSFIEQATRYRLNGAARQVMGDLMWARMEAVNQNNEFNITFPDTLTYIILDDDNSDGIADISEETKTINIQDNFLDVTLSSTDNPVFSPRGTVTNLATITLTNTAGSRQVLISIAGSVKIQ